MYIRRKVFSRFVDESGEEKLFSTTEFSYMTEEEQKEFADKKENEEKKEEKKSDKLAKAAKATGIAVGSALAAAGLYQGGKKAGQKITKNMLDRASRGSNGEKIVRAKKLNDLFNNENALDRFGYKVQGGIGSATRWTGDKAKKAGKWTGDTAKKGYEKVKSALKKKEE